jgi:hypothetical protein
VFAAARHLQVRLTLKDKDFLERLCILLDSKDLAIDLTATRSLNTSSRRKSYNLDCMAKSIIFIKCLGLRRPQYIAESNQFHLCSISAINLTS